jgi:pimeloyl-ACP methyl ester carboxylesterase
MKDKGYIFRLLPALLIIAALLGSCKDEEPAEYSYFVSDQQTGSFTESYINSMLNISAQSFPELGDVQPFISDGVTVYRISYKTSVSGVSAVCSGLVSVPSTPGEYPVLSFQNGTNTVNSNCPSLNPFNYLYQLAEFIASMGFVVIIPDYPGFGNSSDIPHPYLISEPTTGSILDMFRAVNEAQNAIFPGISIKNEYYLMGYSQGGWATMALHKSLDADPPAEFNLAGSVCGAGPYDMYNLFSVISGLTSYPMPSYIGYIIHAYSVYNQFDNPVSDILNEPYDSRISTLYDGTLSTTEINTYLTTSITGLFRPEFISGFATSPDYASIREGLVNNSISPWHTTRPLMLVHGGGDTHVSVTATENFYTAMINAGTSPSVISKLIVPDLDHGDALVPCVTEGLKFIINLRDN